MPPYIDITAYCMSLLAFCIPKCEIGEFGDTRIPLEF